MFSTPQKLAIQKIELPILKEKKVALSVLRLDQTHAIVSGNKWFKLKHNIIEAYEKKCNTLITFGGAYSNHLVAVASAGKETNFKTIGIVRGEEILPLNPTLKTATQLGMKLHYVSRSEYRIKEHSENIKKIISETNNPYIIPEGGTNVLAVKGISEIFEFIPKEFNYISTAVGTAGTISGLVLPNKQFVVGISVLKGDFHNQIVEQLIGFNHKNYEIFTNYHFGGYAKFNHNLIDFINEFYKITRIPLDPVYTGKHMFAVLDLISKNYFKQNSKILFIHTGGLQGIDGFNERFGNKIIFM